MPASTMRGSCDTSPRSSPAWTASTELGRHPVRLADAQSVAFIRSGKVRDLYDVCADRILLVASDRISAFDVILPSRIPDKGRVLTGLSRYSFAETTGIVPNHLLSTNPD